MFSNWNSSRSCYICLVNCRTWNLLAKIPKAFSTTFSRGSYGSWRPAHSGPCFCGRRVSSSRFRGGRHQQQSRSTLFEPVVHQWFCLREANGVIFDLLPQVTVEKNLAVRTLLRDSNVKPDELIVLVHQKQNVIKKSFQSFALYNPIYCIVNPIGTIVNPIVSVITFVEIVWLSYRLFARSGSHCKPHRGEIVEILNPEITSDSGSQIHHTPFTLPSAEPPIIGNFPIPTFSELEAKFMICIAEMEQPLCDIMTRVLLM